MRRRGDLLSLVEVDTLPFLRATEWEWVETAMSGKDFLRPNFHFAVERNWDRGRGRGRGRDRGRDFKFISTHGPLETTIIAYSN